MPQARESPAAQHHQQELGLLARRLAVDVAAAATTRPTKLTSRPTKLTSRTTAGPPRTQLAVLRPTGEMSPNGLASWYDDAFPPACAPHVTPDEFARAMTKINEALTDHWPCVPCSAFALGCCVCTLGLSLYCASTQVAEAEARAQLQIRRINAQRNLRAKGVEFRLVRVWYTRRSYVEITLGPPTTDSDGEATGEGAETRGDARAPETQSMNDRLV